jgi:pimeloyl-ACP methyl ester carboxylesterase
MYVTTNTQGQAVGAVTTVLIPKGAPASGRKILSYQSFYDSLTQTCTPSILTAQGKLFESGYVKTALRKGVVVVMSDYEGLNNQWIAGLNTAHGVLDGIRAAINFNAAGLTANAPVAMMGFSGGGHATGWAAEVAPEYAPELNIVGAAMGGVPANIANVARKVDGGLFSSVYLGAVVGLSRAYPEIDPAKYATPAGLTAIKDIGNRCLLGMFQGQSDMLIKYALTKSTKFLKDPNFLDLPEIAAIIQENNMGSRTPTAPLYVYQGTNDQIMPIKDVDDLVANYCSKGLKVQYSRTTGDHLLMAVSPVGAMNWSLDRLAGKAAPSNCK